MRNQQIVTISLNQSIFDYIGLFAALYFVAGLAAIGYTLAENAYRYSQVDRPVQEVRVEARALDTNKYLWVQGETELGR